MTAGLNVPADSNPSPIGARIGSATTRVHFPKGGAKEMAATAAKAMRIKADTPAVCAVRFEKRPLIITRLPSLLTNRTQKQSHGAHLGRSGACYMNDSKLGRKLDVRLSRDLWCRFAGLAIHTQAN